MDWKTLLGLGAQVSGYQNPWWANILLILAGMSGFVSLIVGSYKAVRWFKSNVANTESILFRALAGTRRKLIPLMLVAMGIAGIVLLVGAVAGGLAYSNPEISGSSATKETKTANAERLIKDEMIDFDETSGRMFLRGRFLKGGKDLRAYVAYGQADSRPDRSINVLNGLQPENRIRVDAISSFDKEEEAFITIGMVSPVGGNQLVLQWGKPDLNNKKVGVTWGTYFGYVFLVTDGHEEKYSFAIVSRSNSDKQTFPFIFGPGAFDAYQRLGGPDAK